MECNEHRDSLGNVPFVVRGEDNDNVARCLSFSCRLSEESQSAQAKKAGKSGEFSQLPLDIGPTNSLIPM